MMVIKCDACGDRVVDKMRSMITILIPTGVKGRTVADVLGDKDSRYRKEVFDLCAECGMQLVVSIKTSKLRISRGERPV